MRVTFDILVASQTVDTCMDSQKWPLVLSPPSVTGDIIVMMPPYCNRVASNQHRTHAGSLSRFCDTACKSRGARRSTGPKVIIILRARQPQETTWETYGVKLKV